jgi:hypothetical protein
VTFHDAVRTILTSRRNWGKSRDRPSLRKSPLVAAVREFSTSMPDALGSAAWCAGLVQPTASQPWRKVVLAGMNHQRTIGDISKR